ncbi:hypothetical protein [Mesorhizobium sp. B2-3-4]|uniref:hypothetical protein n=1 Tax=Mesorhizobium sp. B2-3-4 TaxID=2589959 RepID=UPI00116E35DC|nr:hypothetical protein [Mesorhizobium sp. B2-3-4]TPM25112.1 hypothetical protein FJ967_32790 [Mesorhizobium sp. B2-3-4]
MSIFYRTKDAGCLDRLVASLDRTPPGIENGAIIGFFAALFDSSPQMRRTLLDAVHSNRAAATYFIALSKAGLADEARRFASAHGLEGAISGNPTLLKDVRPVSVPLDNDLLIGAYMATGDLSYVDHILENLRDSRDGMAADAIRMGLLMGKFGGPAPGRPNIMTIAACRKYGCPRNQPSEDMMREMTIASAVWAVGSLAKNDVAIKQELDRFVRADLRLSAIYETEQNAFARYLTLVTLWSANKDSSLDEALMDYERLGAADALLKPDRLPQSPDDKK